MASELSGRALPGRLSFAREGADTLAVAASLVALGLLTLATRLPFRTRYLMNWDAVQFALGVRHFDVVHHQPHPPGYIGYVAIGRLLTPLFGGDVNAALVSLSISGEIAAVALAFLFARSLFGDRAAWAAALALVAAPLFWYYGEVANTYALEPALALAIAWPCWRLWRGDAGAAPLAAAALGLTGAVRPSTTVLLAPLFFLALLRSGATRAAVAGAVAVLAAAVAAWLIPLLVAAGGPLALLSASLQLGGSVTAGTAFWNAPLNPIIVGLNAVLTGLGWELGMFLVFAVFAFAVAPRLLRVEVAPPGFGLFAAAWAAPALLTFVFIHIGQVVYIQVFAPLLFLTVGPALEVTAAALGRPRLWPWLLATGLAVEVLIFFTPPRYSLAEQLRLHDLRIEGMVAAVSASEASDTVLLTDAEAVGSYREAQWYLPEYRRVAIGGDRRGRLGEIYGDQYQPWRFARASTPSLPASGTFVVLDPAVVAEVPDRERLERLTLPDGTHLWVWRGPAPVIAGNRLWFDHPGWVRAAGNRV